MEVSVGKGKMLHGTEQWGRRWNSPEHQGQRRRRGEERRGRNCFRCWSRFSLQTRGSHARARADFSEGTAVHGEEPCQKRLLLKGCGLHRGPMMERQKETVKDWLQPPYSTLPCAALDKGRQKSWGFKVWSWVWGKRAMGRECAVLICFSFSLIYSILIGNKLVFLILIQILKFTSGHKSWWKVLISVWPLQVIIPLIFQDTKLVKL